MCHRIHRLLAVAAFLLPATAAAQGVWVPHQQPCKLSTGYYLVKGSMLQLKMGIETQFADERVKRFRESEKILLQAILEKDQGENAAAWYYLGRTYIGLQDYAGADSAFRRAVALAPVCAEDIQGHRGSLAPLVLNEALRTWGAGSVDSSRVFFRLAQRLDSTDAEIPLYASLMYAAQQEPDSAARYLDLGLRAAQQDTAHAGRQRQAELAVARAYEARAFEQVPAIPTLAQARVSRDTTAKRIQQDSVLLDRILTEVGGIRASGGRLNPQALATFQRDSTLLETRIASSRQALDALSARVAEDSAAATAALAEAMRYYGGYVERHPDDPEAALQLLRLYAMVGDAAALRARAARVAASPEVPNTSLVSAAMSLYGDGWLEEAAVLLVAALARNPNDHGALNLAGYVHHARSDTAALMTTARRRLSLAPMDEGAARTMALAWDLAGVPDSTARWLVAADTGLGWNVRVTQFQATDRVSSVNGYVTNATRHPLAPLSLVFEFLDSAGEVVATTTVELPALEPRGRAQLAVRVEQGGAASWRYRRE